MRIHGDVQILPQSSRSQEGLGRGTPASPSDRALGDHETSLVLPVDIAVLVTHLLSGIDESRGQRCMPGRFLHCQVSTCRVVRRLRQVGILIVLRLFEIAQRLRRVPAGVALLLPQVVILSIAAEIQHVVEDARAADYLAPGPVAPAVLHGY